MDKVAIVTAGSKGIGLACAQRLADDGFKVGIMSRSDEAEKVASTINGLGYKGSVESAEDLSGIVQACKSKWGRIDVVVNNTGHVAKGDLLDITDEEWSAGFTMLFLNVVRMARLVTPMMVDQGGGSFINITSYAALEPSLDFPVSSAVRSSISSYARLFSSRFGGNGVRMNCILPGFVNSYGVDDEIRKRIPTGSEGTTEDIASVMSFLASDQSTYVLGESIRVDGGMSRSI